MAAGASLIKIDAANPAPTFVVSPDADPFNFQRLGRRPGYFTQYRSQITSRQRLTFGEGDQNFVLPPEMFLPLRRSLLGEFALRNISNDRQGAGRLAARPPKLADGGLDVNGLPILLHMNIFPLPKAPAGERFRRF